MELGRGYKAATQIGCVVSYGFLRVVALLRPPPALGAAASPCPPLGTRAVAEVSCMVGADAAAAAAHAAAAASAVDNPQDDGGVEESTAAGRAHHPRRSVVGIGGHDGAWAEFVPVAFVNVHAVPDGVPDATAVAFEPLAAARRAVAALDRLPAMAPVAGLDAGRLSVLVGFATAVARPGHVFALGRSAGAAHAARGAGVLSRARLPVPLGATNAALPIVMARGTSC